MRWKRSSPAKHPVCPCTCTHVRALLRHSGYPRTRASARARARPRAVVRVPCTTVECMCDLLRISRRRSQAEVATRGTFHHLKSQLLSCRVGHTHQTSSCIWLDVHGSRGRLASRSPALAPLHGRPVWTRAAKERKLRRQPPPGKPLADFIAALGQTREHERRVPSDKPPAMWSGGTLSKKDGEVTVRCNRCASA